MDRPDLRESIDACRATDDDLSLPELAPLAEQIDADPDVRSIFDRAQRLDGRIAQAMQEAVVPAGLAARIMARLDAERPRVIQSDVQPVVEMPAVERPAGPEHTRRRWLVGVSAVAASMLVALGLWEFYAQGSPLSVDSLLASGSRWHNQLVGNADWQRLAAGQMIQNFPPARVVRASPRSWVDVSAWVGHPAVAYDLNIGPGRRATLFVIHDPRSKAEATVLRVPGLNTGGLAVGVWQAEADWSSMFWSSRDDQRRLRPTARAVEPAARLMVGFELN